MPGWTWLRQKVGSSGFARHALLLGGGNALAQLILIGASPVLARLYTPAAFGTFAIYAALMALLAAAATLHFESALMLPRRHRQSACLLLFILLLCPTVALGLGLPIALFGQPLAALLGAPSLAVWFWLLPLSVTLFGWYQALRYWAMRREAFGDVARNAATRAAVGMGLACLMGLWPPFPEVPEAGLILSQILGEATGNLLLAWRIYRTDRHLLAWPGLRRLRLSAERWRGLALPLAVGDGIAMGYARLPVLAIGWLFGPTAAGLYAWAERFTVLPAQLVASAIGDVYRQRATVEFHRHGRFDGLMRRTFAVTAALAVPPYLLGLLLAPALFAWLFGPVWLEAGQLAQILLIGGLVAFAVTPVDKATVIFQRTRFILLWHTARLVLKLAAVAAVLLFEWSLPTFLWLIVLTRIALYGVDLAYCCHLAKGAPPPVRLRLHSRDALMNAHAIERR